MGDDSYDDEIRQLQQSQYDEDFVTIDANGDESPIEVLKGCIAANQGYQLRLTCVLSELDEAISRNLQEQKQVEAAIAHGFTPCATTQALFYRRFGERYFTDVKRQMVPADNEDTIALRPIKAKLTRLHYPHKWALCEISALHEGVRDCNRQALLQQVFRDAKTLPVESQAQYMVEQRQRIRDMTDAELESKVEPSVNWNQLAASWVTDRTGAECAVKWIHSESPSINSCPWSEVEDELLIRALLRDPDPVWDDVAADLGTNRTPVQCLMRYQQCLNKSIVKTKWGPDDDKLLKELVERHGTENWVTISEQMVGRTPAQCGARWLKSINPNIVKGKWSQEEDMYLMAAIAKHGERNWSQIALEVPRRTDVQCRERFCNMQAQRRAEVPWTEQENNIIIEQYEALGNKWAEISRILQAHGFDRDDSQVLRQWKRIDPDAARHHLAARHVLRQIVAPRSSRKLKRPKIDQNRLSDFFDLYHPIEDTNGDTSSDEETTASQTSRARSSASAAMPSLPTSQQTNQPVYSEMVQRVVDSLLEIDEARPTAIPRGVLPPTLANAQALERLLRAEITFPNRQGRNLTLPLSAGLNQAWIKKVQNLHLQRAVARTTTQTTPQPPHVQPRATTTTTIPITPPPQARVEELAQASSQPELMTPPPPPDDQTQNGSAQQTPSSPHVSVRSRIDKSSLGYISLLRHFNAIFAWPILLSTVTATNTSTNDTTTSTTPDAQEPSSFS